MPATIRNLRRHRADPVEGSSTISLVLVLVSGGAAIFTSPSSGSIACCA
jgi:hypothetical protein